MKASWERLLASKSGIRHIDTFDVSDLSVRIAAMVPKGAGEDAFRPEDYVPAKDVKKMDEFIHYALGAADEAIRDAGWAPEAEEELDRTGVMIGSGIGGLPTIAEGAVTMEQRGPRRVSPFFIPGSTDQSGLGSGLDQIRFPRPEPRGRYRLLHRCARHRRCRAADHVGRCRCDGGRRF